jgi:hypothetical protein
MKQSYNLFISLNVMLKTAVLEFYYSQDLTVFNGNGEHSILYDSFPFICYGGCQKYASIGQTCQI